jgi:hypothetical protein
MAEASINLALAARFRRCAPGPRRGAGRGTGEMLLARLPAVHGPLSPETRGALARRTRRCAGSDRKPAHPDRAARGLRRAAAARRRARRRAQPPSGQRQPAPRRAAAGAGGQRRHPCAHDRRERRSGPRRGARGRAHPREPVRGSRPHAPVPPRSGRNPCSARLARAIPRRPGNAAPGLRADGGLGNGSGSGRDNAIISEAMRGNVPDHMSARCSRCASPAMSAGGRPRSSSA